MMLGGAPFFHREDVGEVARYVNAHAHGDVVPVVVAQGEVVAHATTHVAAADDEQRALVRRCLLGPANASDEGARERLFRRHREGFRGDAVNGELE